VGSTSSSASSTLSALQRPAVSHPRRCHPPEDRFFGGAAVQAGYPDAVKEALATLIDRVEISHDRQAQPYFRIPKSDVEEPGPSKARALVTPVRMGPRSSGAG